MGAEPHILESQSPFGCLVVLDNPNGNPKSLPERLLSVSIAFRLFGRFRCHLNSVEYWHDADEYVSIAFRLFGRFRSPTIAATGVSAGLSQSPFGCLVVLDTKVDPETFAALIDLNRLSAVWSF